jgi:hypothetical protein
MVLEQGCQRKTTDKLWITGLVNVDYVFVVFDYKELVF